MPAEYKQLIAEACDRVYQLARNTPLDFAPQLSSMLENKVWLKREDQQPGFSYKLRGAYNMISTLADKDKANGVITASAGNHAQGVALAAKQTGITATIVMPKTTPEIKVNAVKRMDAQVILHGNTYDEAFEYCRSLVESQQKTFVPAYDHPLVIAGQATVAVEILAQARSLPDIVFVPVGGGGLIAGIATYMKQNAPDIKIIGVEHDEAPCMQRALQAGQRVVLDQVGIFADGAAVRQAGEEPFRICRELIDEVILVNLDEICAAVKEIFEDTRSIPEPAGALALAGLKHYVQREKLTQKDLVAIFSGANVNFDRLRHIAELAELGEQREALIGVNIPERPGSFRTLCHDLGPRGITEFNYRYADVSEANVFIGIRLRHGVEEKQTLIQNLIDKGYKVKDVSHDEVAKMHIRYMVGGHAAYIENELLYRFLFPERAGALLHFLNQMGGRWNISLFHYRNHGSAYGRVLMGIQVPPEQRDEFQQFLDQLGIEYSEETNNPAYEMFLS